MSRLSSAACLLALCLLDPASATAGDVTIDSGIKLTQNGAKYDVEYSGTLSLKDLDGNYEQWAAITVWLEHGTTLIPIGTNSLTKPTLKATGSYVAFGAASA